MLPDLNKKKKIKEFTARNQSLVQSRVSDVAQQQYYDYKPKER